MKTFTVYKTTNLVNGKYYIGKHETNDIDDDYLGSGLLLRRAINHYGSEYFKKEILHLCKTRSDMEDKERELVNEGLINDNMTYNIALGGQGGNLGSLVNKKIGLAMSAINSGKSKSIKHKKLIGSGNKDKVRSDDFKNNLSVQTKERMKLLTKEERKNIFGHSGDANGFYGKKHTLESIHKMKQNRKCTKGENNPNAKKITIDGITYNTYKECMNVLNISRRKLLKLLGDK